MSPSNRTYSLTFVAFASLAALTGCGAEPAERTLAEHIDGAPLAPIEALDLGAPSGASVLASRVLRTPAAHFADDVHTFDYASGSSRLVVGTDACETDEDCVPDGCHATSCVAASEMAPGELECTADFRYGTTDGGGCLCHVGRCAAVLSQPPMGI